MSDPEGSESLSDTLSDEPNLRMASGALTWAGFLAFCERLREGKATYRECLEAGEFIAAWGNAPRVDDLIPKGMAWTPFESQAGTLGVFARGWVWSVSQSFREAAYLNCYMVERNGGRAFDLVRAIVENVALKASRSEGPA